MFLYHYFDETTGPFVNLSDIPVDEAKAVLESIKKQTRPRADDRKEYRRQLYTYEEILLLIEKYGLPQIWNNDGTFGPERYIEAHIWSDETIDRYRTNWRTSR